MCRPRQSRRSIAGIAACLAAAALTGCAGSGGGGGDGGGGGTSAAGATGGGGTGGSSSAGVTGTGGVSGASGSSGGGIAGTGGASGPGGSSSGGGGSGSGGSSSGGVSGTGGAAGPGGSNSVGGASGTGGGVSGAGGSTGGGRGGSSGRGGASGGAGGTSSTCSPGTPLTGGQQYCSNIKGNIAGGYSYELWAEGTGSGCMTVYGVDARFKANWTNVEDFLARVGLSFDQTRTPAQIGTISADFAETKTGGTTGLVYIGIYGWTVDPLREYYILDDWGTTMPAGIASDGTPRDHVGTITVDGGTYEVWKKTRTNKPAITGDNKTFDQYFSIRQTARQCGHISISEHFTHWNNLGLPLGKLYEAKILVEAQDTTGTIDFTKATVTVR
jgi:endo-1,4-beta-xylanase